MAGASQPNILLVHCHDLGQYLGCYGVDVETPNLDRLAADGALFENHFGTAPQCSPSRGSLMTGRYPHTNGLMGLAHGSWEFDEDERTLPQYLNDAGYTTHLFGLQHETSWPERLGYDHISTDEGVSPEVNPSGRGLNRAGAVVDILEEFLPDAPDPFFASCGFFEAHRVQDPETELFDFAGEDYETPDPTTVTPPSYLPDRDPIRQDLAELHGMVRAVDEAIGRLLRMLEHTGLAEDTLLIFTTEHGIAFPRAKGSLFDPGIEAALLLRYPGTIESGARYDELVSNVDILPTILDLLGEEVPANVAGQSLLPLLAGEPYTPRTEVFAEMTWHDRYNPTRAVRTERFKYARSFWRVPKVYMARDVYLSRAGQEVDTDYSFPDRAYEELYDLDADPLEQENVAADPNYANVVERLRNQLRAWMDETGDPLLSGPVPPGDYDRIMFSESTTSHPPSHQASTQGDDPTDPSR